MKNLLLLLGTSIIMYSFFAFAKPSEDGFQFVIDNNGSSYADSDLYWTIVCQNQDGLYCHMDATGNLIPMDTSDNNVVVGTALNCNKGNKFANYSTPLSTSNTISVSNSILINSAILYISVDGFLPLCILEDSLGHVSYAPPSFENPSLQGYDMIFQAVEFAFNVRGLETLNINTTNVDELGISVTVALTDGSGTDTVGFTESRNRIIQAFHSCQDTQFANLIIPSSNGKDTLRILSPEHVNNAIFSDTSIVNYFTEFYTDYINKSWKHYNNKTITIYNSGTAYTGQLKSDTFYFNTGKSLGKPEFQFPKPSSNDVMSATGAFTSGSDAQKNVGKVLAAAIYRTVFLETPTDTLDSWCGEAMVKKYFTNEPVNYYSSILIPLSIDSLVYSYAYSDVCKQSSSLASTTTQKITISILD